MTQDERLIPAGRKLDKALVELAEGRPYGRYDRYGGSAAETNLREYLFVILKRKWLIMSLVLVVTSLVTIQVYRQPSIYEAGTTIRMESKPVPVLATGQVVITGPADPNFWGTQLKLLQNPSLARQVILSLNLQNSPAFLGGQAQSSVFASLKRIFSRERTATPPAQTNPAADQTIGADEMKERQFTPEELARLEPYEDAIIGSENVEPIAGTSLVTIKYQHTDPELAQRIANTLADVFVQNNRERQASGNSKAEIALAQEIAKYQDKTKKEQDARFAFARDHDLPLGPESGTNIEVVRANTYSGQLLAAENERRNLLAAYDAAKNAPDPFANPEVLKDERIIKLREKLSDLKDKESALLQKYTREWPEVKQIQAQIQELEGELAKAPVEVLASMKSRADAAVAHEKSLEKAYSIQHGKTTSQTRNEIELAARTAELTTDQQYLNTLMQKRRELTATGSDGGADVRVETYSRMPHAPVGPARLRNIIIAFALALVAGIGLAFLLDYLDDTVKSMDDVDRYIHLPALALIPSVRSEKRLRGAVPEAKPGDSTALAMVGDVRSPIAESYRHLRTSLLLSSAGTPPKTILVTSSQPSEGKTTTAINTAFMLAQTGADVLIIDCDLRRPRLHAHFNLPNTRGLTNFLSGESEVEELLQPYDKLPKLKVLTSGPIPPNPAELLGSEEMRRLLSSLGEKFTHIIVDSPPAISFTDASILSTFVDGVILVVHGGRSSRAVVRRAKQQLLDVGAHIFGVVLNNVKVEKTRDYYYAGYYSGYYKSDEYRDEDGAAKQNTQAASD
jgi:capsular exopolysaccharide synthesis family protein